MKTLFTCLVSNSLKFTSGSVSPNVTIEASEKAGRWAFKISDNGIGIEAKHCHSVFEVFKKAVSDDLYPGRGIGLALAKKIVERHGGSIAMHPGSVVGAEIVFDLLK